MGIPTLISTTTASGDASVSITSGITSSYDEYMFLMIDMYITFDSGEVQFNGSTDGGSNYNVTKTTTHYYSSQNENAAETQFGYNTSWDLAQSTGNHFITGQQGDNADDSASGILTLYSPSNTTYVKHFMSRMQVSNYTPRSNDHFTAGYFNTTSAIDAIIFAPNSETLSGVVQLYGIK